MKLKRPSLKHNRRGVTAVEFALTVPVLFLFLFATYELGRANMMSHTAEAAAYEGARLGIVPGATAAEAEAGTRAVLATAGIRNAVVTVVPPDLTDDTPTVSVQVSFKFGDNTFIGQTFIGNGDFVRNCELTRERK